MKYLIGAVLVYLAFSAMTGGNPSSEPLPGPTVPSSAAMTVPNPGFAPHCGFGPNDSDVRGIISPGNVRPNPDC